MRFTTFPILLLALVASVVVADNEHTPNRYKCDTAAQANLADCEVLLNSEDDTVWTAKWRLWNDYYWYNFRSSTQNSMGYRIACNGRCCVFTHWPGMGRDKDNPNPGLVRKKAIQLLKSGCINRATGLINAVGLFDEGTDNEINICIGNVQSGSDCFDDAGDAT